ncbi:hypothetical protein AXG93_3562s1050 [Marchantia polymorpha subsp. ruderalis]|uniref:Uncharacterized protein n=1 Tax=Marchantia polymorpha subsp. ruderalis TaxID=1480154 RepID=A0A176WST1_MARPO|nr:hypothetical protein AXG93_3562s1050 [Marchantia polymorpha subsp. ruderalis]
MEGDDPSAARDAAVSPANEAAESYEERDEAVSLSPFQGEFPSGGQNVSGPLSDGYQEDQAEGFAYHQEKMEGGNGQAFEYYEEEGGEFLSMATLPASNIAGKDGARSRAPSLPSPLQGRPVAVGIPPVATERSTAGLSVKFASEPSPLGPQSVVTPISAVVEDEEYSGMPKIDADIEVGKKIVRRRKLSVACPPSSFYSDVQPPGLELVQRALRGHKAAGLRPFKRVQPRLSATEFHDEKGHMLLHGCLDGKYVGDVLGGLPHGHGQHWTPPPGCRSAPDYRHLLYEGAWEYGAKTGYGRMFYHNGQYYKDGGFYKGAWCKDNRDGWGAYYWPTKCRKYEGEWVGDDPVCGNHTNILETEYMALKELVPEWCNVLQNLPSSLPKEKLEV